MAKKAKVSRVTPALAVEPEQWPAYTVERWPLDQLKPHPRNVNKHPASQLEELRASFAEHGVVKPFVVREDGVILAGHGGTEALQIYRERGVTHVPVVVARGWSEEQQRKFMLRDNAIPRNSKYDKGGLGLELADLAQLPGVDLQLLGFKQAELDRLIPKTIKQGNREPDDLPAQLPAPVSRRGDIWLLGEHRIICGDCTNPEHVAAVLAGERPNLMATDPPYGVEYDPGWRDRVASFIGVGKRATGEVSNDARADWREAWALFPGDVAYVWHADKFASQVEASLAAAGFEIVCQVVWAKEAPVVSRGDYHWQHEPCWYAVRKGARHNWCGDRSQSTLWEISHRKSDTGHGTQKPVECMRRPMVNNSRPGDAVYDPFCGSGTSIIAAEMSGRRCLALELDPAYVDIACRRWEDYSGKNAILAAGDKRFGEVAGERRREAAGATANAAA